MRLLSKNYFWYVLPVGVALSAAAAALGGAETLSIAGGVLATTLSLCYFLQQQRLSETDLFYRLFTDFNARYDKINGRLADLAESQGNLSVKDRQVVVDYFNLCAEEFLFYQQGYIHDRAWGSWCRGILWYLRRHPFKDVWNEESDSGTYYGLTLQHLERGARLR